MRRLSVYSICDQSRTVRQATEHTLSRLRAESDTLVVVHAGGRTFDAPGRQRIDRLADAVWAVHDPTAFASIYHELRHRLGVQPLAAFDEVVILDDSLLGPINPGPPTLSKIQAFDSDGLLLVDPDLGDGPERTELRFLSLRGHVFRREVFWETCDEGAPDFSGLVANLREAGITLEVQHPRSSERDAYLLRDSINRFLAEGLQFIPWQTFTSDPLVNERWGIVPRESYNAIIARGFPSELVWDKLLHAVPPRTWYTNLAMAEVLPVADAPEAPVEFVTAVIAHIYYVDMADELLELAARIPGRVRLYVTAADEQRRDELERQIGEDARFEMVDVRAVTSNLGRDISAFFIDCQDVLRDPDVDLVVKLHSKRSVQDPASVSAWFRRHLFESLFASDQYVRNVFELFRVEPQLGMVFPPTIHMGLPTLGHAWSLNLEPALNLAPRLGVTIPFDTRTPLSPYGSMFIARREALAPVLNANFDITEFPDAASYRDGSLAHVLERLVSYVAFSHGFYAKTVTSPEVAAISGVALEQKLAAVSEFLPPHAIDQVKSLSGRGEVWPLMFALRRIVWVRAESRLPGAGRVLSLGFRWLRGGISRLKRQLRG